MAEANGSEMDHKTLVRDEAYVEAVITLVAVSAHRASNDVVTEIHRIEKQADEYIADGEIHALTDGCVRNLGRIAALRDCVAVFNQDREG